MPGIYDDEEKAGALLVMVGVLAAIGMFVVGILVGILSLVDRITGRSETKDDEQVP